MPMPDFFKEPEHCLKKLSVGTKVREQKSGIVFLIAEHNHENWNCTTLITDSVIKNVSYDAKEPDSQNKFIRAFGNSDYILSNVHQWLNSDKKEWYHPSHFKDLPPTEENIEFTPEFYYHSPNFPEVGKLKGPFDYVNEPGFLTWFSEEFKNSIVKERIPVFTVKETGQILHEELYTGVFLPSLCEVGCEYQDPEHTGTRFKLFEDPIYKIAGPTAAACEQEEGYEYKEAVWWYLTRNPSIEKPGLVFKITPGYRGGIFASRQAMLHRCCYATGIRPMVNVKSAMMVSEQPDEDGVYDLILPPGCVPTGGHDMMAIPGNLTQTLSITPKLEDKFSPGCVCTNLTCVRHGMCASCSYYHSSAYGTINLFEPGCRLDHGAQNFALVDQCFDELGNCIISYKDLVAKLGENQKG